MQSNGSVPEPDRSKEAVAGHQAGQVDVSPAPMTQR